MSKRGSKSVRQVGQNAFGYGVEDEIADRLDHGFWLRVRVKKAKDALIRKEGYLARLAGRIALVMEESPKSKSSIKERARRLKDLERDQKAVSSQIVSIKRDLGIPQPSHTKKGKR